MLFYCDAQYCFYNCIIMNDEDGSEDTQNGSQQFSFLMTSSTVRNCIDQYSYIDSYSYFWSKYSNCRLISKVQYILISLMPWWSVWVWYWLVKLPNNYILSKFIGKIFHIPIWRLFSTVTNSENILVNSLRTSFVHLILLIFFAWSNHSWPEEAKNILRYKSSVNTLHSINKFKTDAYRRSQYSQSFTELGSKS